MERRQRLGASEDARRLELGASTVNAMEAQAIVRNYQHLGSAAMSSEAVLLADMGYLLSEASKALGIVVDVDKVRVLAALSLLAS